MKYPINEDEFVTESELLNGIQFSENLKRLYRSIAQSINESYLSAKNRNPNSVEHYTSKLLDAKAKTMVELDDELASYIDCFVTAWIDLINEAWDQGRQEATV